MSFFGGDLLGAIKAPSSRSLFTSCALFQVEASSQQILHVAVLPMENTAWEIRSNRSGHFRSGEVAVVAWSSQTFTHWAENTQNQQWLEELTSWFANGF